MAEATERIDCAIQIHHVVSEALEQHVLPLDRLPDGFGSELKEGGRWQGVITEDTSS